MSRTEEHFTGFVSALFLSQEKGTPRQEISEGYFKSDHGLEGDAWSGPGDRQVVILSHRRRQDVLDDIRNGLCYSKFMETLQVAELALEECPVGTQFSAGEAVLEITRVGKRCFKECEVVQSGSFCSLRKGAVFARVLQSGKIRRDDRIKILQTNPESA